MRPHLHEETPAMLRVWANQIEVEKTEDGLEICGTIPGRALPEDLLQLFQDYVFAPNSEREAKGPHLEFANAESDADLVRFIKKWGPITAPSVSERGGSKKTLERLGGRGTARCKRAVENLKRVRTVQAVLSAAVSLLKISREERPSTEVAILTMNRLIAALKTAREATHSVDRPTEHVEVIHNRTASEATVKEETELRQQEIKFGLRRADGTIPDYPFKPAWPRWDLLENGQKPTVTLGSSDSSFVCELGSVGLGVECELIYRQAIRRRGSLKCSELRYLCQDILCALVNRNPDNLVATKEGVLTVPAAGHGVLPILMFMLRQDLISGRKIIVCEKCGNYLLQRRRGETACSSCKEGLRSKKYYDRNSQKILQRRKEKRLRVKAKQLRSLGLSWNRIAKQLRTRTQTVKRWVQQS